MAKDDCCLGCIKRRVGCHASCPDYISFKKRVEERRAETYRKKQLDCAFIDHNVSKRRK